MTNNNSVEESGYTDMQLKGQKDKILSILDKAECEGWFDMPNTTQNWMTWKRIRNTIVDILKEEHYAK